MYIANNVTFILYIYYVILQVHTIVCLLYSFDFLTILNLAFLRLSSTVCMYVFSLKYSMYKTTQYGFTRNLLLLISNRTLFFSFVLGYFYLA